MADDNSKPATRGDVRKIVSEIVIDATHKILEGVERLLENHATKDDLSRVERKIDKLEVEVRHVKDVTEGLKADLSVTPSRGEFEELKARVDRYHPMTS
jgi:hypothetical protein